MKWLDGGLRKGFAIAGGVVVVAGVVVLIVTTTTPGVPEAKADASHADVGSGSATPTSPEPETTVAAPPAPSGSAVPTRPVPSPVVEVLHGYHDVSAKALHSGKVDQQALSQVTDGFVQGAIEAHAQEFAENGWHQVGQPKIVWSHTVARHLDAQPPTVTIEACVDSSDVRILDKSGKPVLGTANKPPRVPNLYTLAKTGGTWKVTGHSFPRQPTC